MNYTVLKFSFFIIIAFSLYGIDLDEAIRKTLLGNLKIKGEEYRLLADEQQNNQAISAFFPTVSATFSHDLKNSDWSKNSKSITLTQPLFASGANIIAYKKAKKLSLISKTKFLQLKQEMLIDAVKAYSDVLEKEKANKLHEHNIYAVEQRLEAEEERLKVGELTKVDVEKVRYNLSVAKSDKIKSEGELGNAYAHYLRIVGEPAKNLHEPKKHPEPPKSLQDAINLAMKHSVQLRSAKLLHEIAEYSLQEASAQLLPSVSANISWAEDEAGKERHSAMILASIPLFQKGAEYLKIKQAQYLLAQSKENYYEIEKSVEEQVTIAWNTLITSKSFLKSSNKEVESRQILLDSQKEAHKVHLSTTLDVLDEENKLLKAKKQSFTAKMQYLLAAYNLAILTNDIDKMF